MSVGTHDEKKTDNYAAGHRDSQQSKKKSLGSWFPSASLIKNRNYGVGESISICLFYQYIQPLWSERRKTEAISFIEEHAERLNVGGRVRVALEGVNATVSSSHSNLREFIAQLGEFDSHFKTTDFKYIDNLPLDRAFKDLKVLPVGELVYYGISSNEELGPGGVHLEPKEYHQKLGEKDTVVIDVRNTYESDIGNFGAQQKVNGAELLIPDMRKSTDFPEWIEREETKQKLHGKNVLMYCTGGVRCERASCLLKSKYGEDIQEVYQLQGGIERYLQQYPDGGYWQGKNYVFDKREAVAVGQPEGVGGVVLPTKPKLKNKNDSSSSTSSSSSGSKIGNTGDASGNDVVPEVDDGTSKTTNDSNSTTAATVTSTTTTTAAATAAAAVVVLGRCCVCSIPWDRYIGKKKCAMCGVPVLLCTSCCTKKGMLDKQTQKQTRNQTQSSASGGDGLVGIVAAAAAAASTSMDGSTIDNNNTSDVADTAAVNAGGVGTGTGKKGKKRKLKKEQQLQEQQKQQQLQKEQQEHRLRALRCPLCVAQNCVVPVEDILLTANGRKATANPISAGLNTYANEMPPVSSPVAAGTGGSSLSIEGVRHGGGKAVPVGNNKKMRFSDEGEALLVSVPTTTSTTAIGAATAGRAATTVCKWGGGHSSREARGKSSKKHGSKKHTYTEHQDSATTTQGTTNNGDSGEVKKINRPCQFGADCHRPGCWFQH